jgi:DNA-binding FadR family transcriptional regulator
MPLQAVGNTRLYRQIADQLSQLIGRGEFAPGARLPAERELAAALGVSRASVREAIISLEIAGLIEVRVGTGIFVTGPAPDAALAPEAGPGPFELLSARSLVEGEIAALAARAAKADDLAAIDRAIERMVAHNDDFAIREDSDREFHLAIAAATGNGSLLLVVEGLWAQRAELWRRLQSHYHTPQLALQTIHDHRAIAAAIRARDPAAARRAMQRHFNRVAREFQREQGEDAAAQPVRKPLGRAQGAASAAADADGDAK